MLKPTSKDRSLLPLLLTAALLLGPAGFTFLSVRETIPAGAKAPLALKGPSCAAIQFQPAAVNEKSPTDVSTIPAVVAAAPLENFPCRTPTADTQSQIRSTNPIIGTLRDRSPPKVQASKT